MTTLTNWLVVLLAVSLSAVAILTLVLDHLRQKRWMRIFSESRGIPAAIMENSKPEPREVPHKIDNRPRITVPVPAGFRETLRKP